MQRTSQIVVSVAIIALVGALLSLAAFSAFSATTSNPNNAFGAGSVAISDNDADSALYSVSGAKPTDSSTRCIRVTYTGSLPSTVKLYRSAFTAGTGLDPYINLTITRGSGTAADCSDFSGSVSVYSGTLNAMGTSFGDSGAVTLTDQSGGAAWDLNDAVTYRVTATLADDNNANGKVTGTHSFTWEARNN